MDKPERNVWHGLPGHQILLMQLEGPGFRRLLEALAGLFTGCHLHFIDFLVLQITFGGFQLLDPVGPRLKGKRSGQSLFIGCQPARLCRQVLLAVNTVDSPLQLISGDAFRQTRVCRRFFYF